MNFSIFIDNEPTIKIRNLDSKRNFCPQVTANDPESDFMKTELKSVIENLPLS